MLKRGLAWVVVLAVAAACGVTQRTVLETSAGSGGSSGTGGSKAGSMSGQAAQAARAGSNIGDPVLGGAGGIDEPTCTDGANPSPMQALSSWEYRRSVVALTGTEVSETLPPDSVAVAPFAWAMNLDSLTIEKLFAEAEKQGVAARAGTLLPCPTSEPVPADCATAFVDTLLRRAFRRVPSQAERDRYVGLFKLASATEVATGVEVVVTAALFSPHFLYKAYWGDAGGQLASSELASKLSYLLTGSPPDDALMQAADNGNLLTDEEQAAQARRLIDGPVHRDAIQHFHAQWLGLDRLAQLQTPGLTPALLASMRTDTEWFIQHAFDSRALPNLFQSSAAYVDHELGAYYDVPAPEIPEAGAGFKHVSLDPARYFGLLTRGSTLALFNNPTQRGKFVREQLLCQSVPPPPPGIVTDIQVSPGQTRRQAWEQHRQDPACAACHSLMDFIGFGFEHFDELGRYRLTDNGQPIDASGELLNAGDADGPFADLNELAQSLSASEAVARCYATTWLTYAQQRALGDGDACMVDKVYAAFASTDFDLVELFLAIARSSQFRSRDALMVGTPPPVAGPSGSVASVAERRQLLLDFSMSELASLLSLAPPEYRVVFELHLTSLRELEQQLSPP